MPAPRQLSRRQMEIIIEFMEANREVAVGRVQNTAPLAKQAVQQKWEELATMLNSVAVGPTKTAARWREYWNELRYGARKKASEQRRQAEATGGGPAKQIVISAFEERILGVIGTEAVYGNECVRLPFNDPPVTPPEPIPLPEAVSEPQIDPALEPQMEVEGNEEPENAHLVIIHPPPAQSRERRREGARQYVRRSSVGPPEWAQNMNRRQEELLEALLSRSTEIATTLNAMAADIKALVQELRYDNGIF